MKSNSFWQTTATLYGLLLSGLLFRGIPIDGNESVSCLAVVLLTVAALICVCVCFVCAARTGDAVPRVLPDRLRKLFLFGGVLCCLTLSSSSLAELSQMAIFSESFVDRHYACVFSFLSLLLCLYLAARGMDSVSRMATLLLPILLFVPIVSFFAFRDYRGDWAILLPNGMACVKIDYFQDALLLVVTVFLYILRAPSKKRSCGYGKAAAVATGAFLFTAVAEATKLWHFFGANGAETLACPERSLLAAIPYVNVQEVYGFVVYFSFILRLTTMLEAASGLFEELAAPICLAQKNKGLLKSAVIGGITWLGTIAFQRLPGRRSVSLIGAGAAAVLLVGAVLYESATTRFRRKKKRPE